MRRSAHEFRSPLHKLFHQASRNIAPSSAPSAVSLLVTLFLAMLASASFVAAPALAQNTQSNVTSSINGTLTDPSDAAVSGAAINLQDLSSSPTHYQTVSTADGRFHLDVPPGRYRLTIAHASLKNFEQDLELTAGEHRDLRLQLAIEPLAASVVVSAEAQPIATAEASEPVDILTRTEIDQRQAIELAPLLQTLPGFALGQSGPAGGVVSLFLDGGNSNFTKVLVDGVAVNQPGGAVDFSNFTLDNIDKVEVVHGAESALTGSDAVTGTVEILTHRGSTHTPLLVVESDGGSFDTGRGSAQLSGLDGRFDYSAAAAYFETQGQGVNDRFVNRTLSGNFGLLLTEHQSLRLTLRSNTSDAGQPGQTLFTPPNLDQHDGLHNISAGLAWNFSTGTHWQHQVFASESDIHQLYQNLLADFYISPDPFDECDPSVYIRSPQAVPSLYCDYTYNTQNQYNRADFQAQSTYVARKVALTAGYWYEVENGWLADLDGLHARRNNQAGFLDGRWQVTSRLALNAGFRLEDNSNFGTRGVPRGGLAYTLRFGHDFFDATRLRFTYGQGIKEPSLDESFGSDPCNPGNPTLRPEQSTTYDASVEQSLAENKVNVSAGFFDNELRDIISFTSCFPGGPCPVAQPAGCPFGFGTYFNTDLARARGSRATFAAHPARWLTIDANYTYDDTRVIASPNAFDPTQLPGNHLLRRPVNSGSIVLNGAFRRLNANLTGVFVGRRTDSDFLYPPLGLTTNPGYARFDLAASYRVSAKLSVIARVQNLLDKKYEDVLGYPALGIGAYAGIRLRLGGDN